MPVLAPPSRLPEAAIPLHLAVPWQKKHYFDPDTEPVPFTRRAFDFWGDPALFPLVHAFLGACSAGRPDEYRYLFDLLGSELAGNAIRHSRSGEHGGTYTLRVDRSPDGLTLTCRDAGVNDGRRYDYRERHYLPAPAPPAEPPDGHGHGLALVDALSTAWGDNGRPTHRHVWFFLAYDLTGSAWPTA